MVMAAATEISAAVSVITEKKKAAEHILCSAGETQVKVLP
jgi:hypothetical protein